MHTKGDKEKVQLGSGAGVSVTVPDDVREKAPGLETHIALTYANSGVVLIISGHYQLLPRRCYTGDQLNRTNILEAYLGDLKALTAINWS